MNKVSDKDLCKAIAEYSGQPVFKCSICGQFFYGYGNNPYPVTRGSEDRCCDLCNDTRVIPARIAGMLR